MGKYTPLEDFLKTYPGDSVELTFSRIEEIIGKPLPDCARRYLKTNLFSLRFWDNLAGASESNARLNAGFQTVMVDMENETVKLQRI